MHVSFMIQENINKITIVQVFVKYSKKFSVIKMINVHLGKAKKRRVANMCALSTKNSTAFERGTDQRVPGFKKQHF